MFTQGEMQNGPAQAETNQPQTGLKISPQKDRRVRKF
jgi:hypothetical protein